MNRDRKSYDKYVLETVARGEDIFEDSKDKGIPEYEVRTSIWKLLSEGKITADENWDLHSMGVT